MKLHQHFKNDNEIVSYCLSKLSNITFVIIICNCNKWITNYCNTSSLSYIQVDRIEDTYIKLFSSFLMMKPSLLYVYSKGTEYWIIKAFVEKSKHLPDLIMISFNYIAGISRKITVPYTRTNMAMYDINYSGCSLNALIILLNKYNYKYIGVFRYARGVIFAKDDTKELIDGCDSNLEDINTIPNVAYGIKNRWPLVEKKFWVNVV